MSIVINKTICHVEGSFPNKEDRKMTHAKQTFKRERKCVTWHIFKPTGFISMQQSIIFFYVEFEKICRKPKSIFS